MVTIIEGCIYNGITTVNTNQHPDILDRHEFVEQTIQLIEVLAKSKSSCTFAINGEWGTGKTFVLNLVEQCLREYEAGTKYLVLHYNCWQYDYYQEPLIAIIAAMLDSVNAQTELLSSHTKETVKTVLAVASEVFHTIASEFVKNKIGVDIVGSIRTACETTSDEFEQSHEYDEYFAFGKLLDETRKKLIKLTKDYHLVIVVDELDRCLPEYAIKVLERLHHLFSGLSNSTVILAVDKMQLDNTVKQMFGAEIKVGDYLKKFISFELTLDKGTVNSSFCEKYDDYIALFEDRKLTENFSVEEYFTALFSGIDVRTQERLMDVLMTVHSLLFGGATKDYSFMCFELLWLVLAKYYKCVSGMPLTFSSKGFEFYREVAKPLASYFAKNSGQLSRETRNSIELGYDVYTFQEPVDIPQLLIWYLEHMFDGKRFTYIIYNNTPHFEKYKEYIEDFKKFTQMLSIIK